ncbi:TetR/AcrR family transcriptional regulator [Xenorhabdus miraniensis]|uniref:TetR family transcriptional regulator n=1 Tax=Xenorhabdus miraniensis TaxID=351674 RepID=A0A2D0JVU9_9GAMM|nr:TetR family transcriptional regulator [Xenorhabdus miraniensis]PHM50487.1 TetR family transcriptional regulator [Xenorhabdus miraniensis]
MKTPKDKFKEKQDAILHSAVSLLVQEGSRSFSMRALANHYGITLGNLQYYFPNLESLLEALFNQIILDTTTRLQLAAPELNKFDVLIDIILTNLQDISLCTLALEALLASRRSKSLHKTLTKFYQHYIEQIITLLDNYCSNTPENIKKEKALMLVSLFEGLSILYSSQNKSTFDFDMSKRLRSTIIAIIESE